MKKLLFLLIGMGVFLSIQAQDNIDIVIVYSYTAINYDNITNSWVDAPSKDVNIKAYVNTDTDVITFSNDGNVKIYIDKLIEEQSDPDGEGNTTIIGKYNAYDDEMNQIQLWIRMWHDKNQCQFYIWYDDFAIRYDAYFAEYNYQ